MDRRPLGQRKHDIRTRCVLILSFLYKTIAENKHHSVAYLTKEAKQLAVTGSPGATPPQLHAEQTSGIFLESDFNTSTKESQRKTNEVH